MSRTTVRRLARQTRRTCRSCQVRRAKFQRRGRVRADRDHNLCFRCFRAERDRQRARQLSPGPDRRLVA
jgi:hypothetical protein